MDISQGFFVDLNKLNYYKGSVEYYILDFYENAISYYLDAYSFTPIQIKFNQYNNFDIDLIAKKDIPKDFIFYKIDTVLFIKDEQLLNKYAAYIWKDNYILQHEGLLLNNVDELHEENCIFYNNYIISSKQIKAGESLRIDYKYSNNNYPPIPNEIIEIRKKLLKPYLK